MKSLLNFINIQKFCFTENITAFAWEPVGNKFAVIHGDSPQINVSFYGIKPGGTVSLLSMFYYQL